ncbi:hypothetical protein PsorP6_005446 [Peronosclerospora sorghi]|uniref:Uncharacterized protein n=1 Tax=Peronosclerospora sorghi TaxID=230839 RepID=A0ACC0W3R3_9STRA|nr:hypothetical protein PsorP6_005446 [Peronosclerospora sorghi]
MMRRVGNVYSILYTTAVYAETFCLSRTGDYKKVQGIKKFVAFLTKWPKPQPIRTDGNDTEKDGEDSKVDTSSTHADDVKIDKEGQTELTDEKDEL